MEQFLIWSEEHGAWWRPASRGYTNSMRQAGRYPRPIAEEIVQHANIGAFHEIIVPIPDGLDALIGRLNGEG